MAINTSYLPTGRVVAHHECIQTSAKKQFSQLFLVLLLPVLLCFIMRVYWRSKTSAQWFCATAKNQEQVYCHDHARFTLVHARVARSAIYSWYMS